MSLFPGPIVELPHISIDNFQMQNNGKSTCFFLSHCHSDHMRGLRDSPFLTYLKNNKNYSLYCSSISKLILQSFYELNHVSNQIKDLGMGLTSLHVSSPDGGISYNLTVSCIPAGHCPGSVMFLFETPQHTILYTGDFRIAKGDVAKFKQLHDAQSVKQIDKLYLDATFFHPSYREFPSRVQSISAIVNEAVEWLKMSPEHNIRLDMTANYGGEYIMNCVAEELKCKIHVHSYIYDLYARVPEVREHLTDRCDTTKIHTQTRKRNKRCLENVDDNNILVIKSKAASFECIENETPVVYKRKRKNYIEVNYSSHSSYNEIVDFLTYLKPKKIEICTETFNSNLAEAQDRILQVQLLWKHEEKYESAVKRRRYNDSSPTKPIYLVIPETQNNEDTDLDSS